jgi:phosphoglycolate phosphatase
VAIAQRRAAMRYGSDFTRMNTVIIGDSACDVEAGRDGGASVIAVASGTASAQVLSDAGAAVVLANLANTDAVIDAVLLLTRVAG